MDVLDLVALRSAFADLHPRGTSRFAKSGIRLARNFSIEGFVLMNDNLFEEMETRAHFVTGSDPWTRSTNDPVVEKTVENAKYFLKKIDGRLGEPNITGGTTAHPETILTLYWSVKNANKILELYVAFLTDNTCRVSWIEPDGKSHQINGLTLPELVKFDVPEKFRKLDSRARHLKYKRLPHDDPKH